MLGEEYGANSCPGFVTREWNYSVYLNSCFFYLAPGVEGGGPHVTCLFVRRKSRNGGGPHVTCLFRHCKSRNGGGPHVTCLFVAPKIPEGWRPPRHLPFRALQIPECRRFKFTILLYEIPPFGSGGVNLLSNCLRPVSRHPRHGL